MEETINNEKINQLKGNISTMEWDVIQITNPFIKRCKERKIEECKKELQRLINGNRAQGMT